MKKIFIYFLFLLFCISYFPNQASANPPSTSSLIATPSCEGTNQTNSTIKYTWYVNSTWPSYDWFFKHSNDSDWIYLGKDKNSHSENNLPANSTFGWSIKNCDIGFVIGGGCTEVNAKNTVTSLDCTEEQPDPTPAPPPSNRSNCSKRSADCTLNKYPECIDTAWSNTFSPGCPTNNQTCAMENRIGGLTGDKTIWTRSCAATTKANLPSDGPIIRCEGEDDTSCPFNRVCVDSDGDGKFACEVEDLEKATSGMTCDKPSDCLSGVCESGKCDNENLAPRICAKSGDGYGCRTAIGYFYADPERFSQSLLRVLLGLSGGILLVLIIFNGYKIMTSQGDPEKIKDAREGIIAAIAGILLIIFSLSILQLITVDVIGIPGFR